MFSEQEAEDDAAIDKRMRDIATGKERQKRRRGGLDFDDSDDEDADKEERDRMRRDRLHNKKRRIVDDSLDSLGQSNQLKAGHALTLIGRSVQARTRRTRRSLLRTSVIWKTRTHSSSLSLTMMRCLCMEVLLKMRTKTKMKKGLA